MAIATSLITHRPENSFTRWTTLGRVWAAGPRSTTSQCPEREVGFEFASIIRQPRAAALLGMPRLESTDTVVTVNPRLCSFCGLCVEACPYEARYLDYDDRLAKVKEVLCKGCGVCAMVCPNKATSQAAFEPKQMLTAIDALIMAG